MSRTRYELSSLVCGLLFAGVSACQDVNSTRCTDGNQQWYCSGDMECHDIHRCVTRVQIDQCLNKEELAPCEIPGVPQGSMRCRHEACVIPYCGDEVIDDAEQCDGEQFGNRTCQSEGFDGGTLTCRSDCTLDTSDCNTCGDGIKDTYEQCDGKLPGDKTCQGLGFDGGTLSCSSACVIDTTSCTYLSIPGSWATIPKGSFEMGSPTGELCRKTDEKQRQVTLTRSFEMSAHEVTQEQFQSLMGYNPSYFSSCGSTCPVEQVTWHEAAAYCNALSSRAGLARCYSCSGSEESITCDVAAAYDGKTNSIYDCPGYRLPTEAEWEYAYRAGGSTAYFSSPGDDGTITSCTGSDPSADHIGWYQANSAVSYAGCYDLSSDGGDACAGTHPVGLKPPNAWLLFDLAGNAWEWCHDWYQSEIGSAAVTDPWASASGYSRVLRGGSWSSTPDSLRAANRNDRAPSHQHDCLGFRPCRTKTPGSASSP